MQGKLKWYRRTITENEITYKKKTPEKNIFNSFWPCETFIENL